MVTKTERFYWLKTYRMLIGQIKKKGKAIWNENISNAMKDAKEAHKALKKCKDMSQKTHLKTEYKRRKKSE